MEGDQISYHFTARTTVVIRVIMEGDKVSYRCVSVPICVPTARRVQRRVDKASVPKFFRRRAESTSARRFFGLSRFLSST